MNIEEARDIIMNERDNKLVFRLVRATTVLASPENDDQVSLAELIQCLKRGNEAKGLALISEYAALALYRRTKRERLGDVPYEDFVTDADDWLNYLNTTDRRG